MSDYLVKGMTTDGYFRIYTLDATETVQRAHEIHDTWSAASAALGRTMIGTILLATSGMQGDGKLTVKIQGDGPVGFMVADGTADATVKAYLANPHVSLDLNDQHKIDVRGAVGTTGTLSVTKMTPGDKTPYTGEVDLISGELGEDFTYYLAQSEQIPSAVGLSVFVNEDESIQVAGGFLVQVLPGATDEAISKLEATLQSLPLVSEMLREGDTPEQIMERIFPADELKRLETMPVKYQCDCSKARFAKALTAINPADLQQLIEEDHGAEAQCRFCHQKYQFSEAELRALQANAAK